MQFDEVQESKLAVMKLSTVHFVLGSTLTCQYFTQVEVGLQPCLSISYHSFLPSCVSQFIFDPTLFDSTEVYDFSIIRDRTGASKLPLLHIL